MANNLPSITLVPNEWTDIYQEAGIVSGTKIAVQNIGSSDVYLSTAFGQPGVESDSYQVIQPNDFPMTNDDGDQGAWAFSAFGGAKISVREIK